MTAITVFGGTASPTLTPIPLLTNSFSPIGHPVQKKKKQIDVHLEIFGLTSAH